MRSSYDYIVIGSGASGSVVARRLAENQDAQVLLLEAGGEDLKPGILIPETWFFNQGGEFAIAKQAMWAGSASSRRQQMQLLAEARINGFLEWYPVAQNLDHARTALDSKNPMHVRRPKITVDEQGGFTGRPGDTDRELSG